MTTKAALHMAEKHETVPVPELPPIAIYYGKGSMIVRGYVWCPACATIYSQETMHMSGVKKPKDEWARIVRESDERVAEVSRRLPDLLSQYRVAAAQPEEGGDGRV